MLDKSPPVWNEAQIIIIFYCQFSFHLFGPINRNHQRFSKHSHIYGIIILFFSLKPHYDSLSMMYSLAFSQFLPPFFSKEKMIFWSPIDFPSNADYLGCCLFQLLLRALPNPDTTVMTSFVFFGFQSLNVPYLFICSVVISFRERQFVYHANLGTTTFS